ncbi:hypothetical protein GF406_03970 [candidate division KSB1 bacterium]|nr:hypothetical protein [candidate division KSB1 bacterium]
MIVQKIWVLLFFPLVLYAQQANNTNVSADTADTPRDVVVDDRPVEDVEFTEHILETIRIEAEVEKPSVTLIPRKAETPVETLPFPERSFEKELMAKPDIILNYGKELESTKRIQKYKNSLEKEDK